jgi:hypothetical protein
MIAQSLSDPLPCPFGGPPLGEDAPNGFIFPSPGRVMGLAQHGGLVAPAAINH